MRRTSATLGLGAALALALAGAGAAPAASPAPRVTELVAGKHRVLFAARTVTARGTTVRVGHRSCAVAAGTPLAALLAARRAGGPPIRLRDFGACSRRAAEGSGLFVTTVGPERNRGQAGWTYKVDGRAGTTGAADVAGPFGTGRRLRSGQRVLWFYCRRASDCQRSLVVRPPQRSLAPGETLEATVRGQDDAGRSRPIADATVVLGAMRARTDARGRARLPAPTKPGRYALTATRAGLADAFPEAVRVR